MQVINESLDDLKRLEDAIETATKGELDYSDKLFLLASAAQSKAIAGLALAIKEGGRQDTFGLTLHADGTSVGDTLTSNLVDNDRPKATIEEIVDEAKVLFSPKTSHLIEFDRFLRGIQTRSSDTVPKSDVR